MESYVTSASEWPWVTRYSIIRTFRGRTCRMDRQWQLWHWKNTCIFLYKEEIVLSPRNQILLAENGKSTSTEYALLAGKVVVIGSRLFS